MNHQKKKKKKKRQRQQLHSTNDPYAHLDASVAAAMRRDDDEIAHLQAKLGVSAGKKKRLYAEYAKMEGYGDDFGEWLDGLDDMVHRVTHNDNRQEDASEEEENDYQSLNGEDSDSTTDKSESEQESSDDEAPPSSEPVSSNSRYVPPHLRKKDDDSLQNIHRTPQEKQRGICAKTQKCKILTK